MDDKLMGDHIVTVAMGGETGNPSTKSSRRAVLKALGTMVAGVGLGSGSRPHRSTFSTTNTTQRTSKERRRYFNNTQENNMNGSPAYITDPGFSLTSLLANLPYILNFADGRPPVILMDTYDYDRLRGRVLRESDNEKIQYLGLAYEELRQRNILQLVDYAKLYPPAVQQQTLQQNQRILEETSEWKHQKAAVEGASGLEQYWGEHQRSFRSHIGEEWETFAPQRNGVIRQRKRMERGGGDPLEWNRNVLHEYVTALKIRRRANQVLNLDVKGVIGQGDTDLLNQILDSTDSQRNIGPTSHIEKLRPNQNMFRFNHSAATQSREILDHVGEIAADVAGVQHQDWSFLGSTFALPKFKNFDHIQSQIRRADVESLVEEAKEVLAVVDKRADGHSPSQARYVADWMGEQYDIPQTQRQGLTKEVRYAFDLVDHSQDLRALGEGSKVSRPAFFLAASAVSDPTWQYETDSLYHQARNLLNQLGPPSVSEKSLKAYRERGYYLTGKEPDTEEEWFKTAERMR